MRKIKATINGVGVNLNVTESLDEYREGARIGGGHLSYEEGYLFDFKKSINIVMENSAVYQDLTVLYFYAFTKCGIVEELNNLAANDSRAVASKGFYRIALELRKDFCVANKISKYSTLILSEDL